MTVTAAPPADPPVAIECHRCGYDVRAQPTDGRCPECNAPVAESRAWAAIPRRPSWRDSDPRWRRRIIAGMWALTLVPLIEVLSAGGLATHIHVPGFFVSAGWTRPLDQTLIGDGLTQIYSASLFCIGLALLSTTERGRRPHPLDWTRRWGLFLLTVHVFLHFIELMFAASLVMVGITAVFQSMPPEHEPAITPWLRAISTNFLIYGPYPGNMVDVVWPLTVLVAVLFVGASLYKAMRSVGPRWLAIAAIVSLGLFAVGELVWVLAAAIVAAGDLLAGKVVSIAAFEKSFIRPLSVFGAFYFRSYQLMPVVETVKWMLVAAITLWITSAQIAVWRTRRSRPSAWRDPGKPGPSSATGHGPPSSSKQTQPQ